MRSNMKQECQRYMYLPWYIQNIAQNKNEILELAFHASRNFGRKFYWFCLGSGMTPR